MGKKRKIWLALLCATVIFCNGCDAGAEDGSLLEENKIAQSGIIQNDAVQGDTEQNTENSAEVEITVAVIDTGFSIEAIPKENILPGKNYCDTQKTTEDTYGHGTAVASVILQYAPEAKLVPLVSSSYEDGKISQVDSTVLAQMIYDAVDIYGCDIINISAGVMQDNAALRQAAAYAASKNVCMIASAGNDYEINGETKYYPAGYESVIAVGSCDEDRTEISTFSQRGDWVDFYASGENVTVKTLSGNTRTDEGTSYSAAKITAAAVWVMEEKTDIMPEKLREQLGKIFPEIQ